MNKINGINDFPLISVWIAARNEENNILDCLKSIEKLEYPIDKMEILIGNDNSTDNTQKVVESFINNKPHFKLKNITKQINNQRGKANVLANLYEHSNGKYFLVVDADVVVRPMWAHKMIDNFQKNIKIGHQVGVSSIRSSNLFHYLQSIDWLLALTLLKLAAFFKIPLTGLGNNSAFTREGYEASGGYAKIPFSITEDFSLFHAIVNQDYRFDNAINMDVYAKTLPMVNLKEFLHQRKRWMVGALQCPFWVVIFLFLQALFPFILLFLGLIFSFKLSFLILLIKFFVQLLLLIPTLVILKELKLILLLPVYEIYAWLWGATMVVFYYLPIKIDWKGRLY